MQQPSASQHPPGGAPIPCNWVSQVAEAFGIPIAAVGCSRPDSASNAPNEHIPLDDLIRHGQLLIELLQLCAD